MKTNIADYIITKKKKILILIVFMALVLPSFAVARVAAEPIPEGCPGSSNPINPSPDICATIPIGCPGSSIEGPIAELPSDCPYDSTTGGTTGSGSSGSSGRPGSQSLNCLFSKNDENADEACRSVNPGYIDIEGENFCGKGEDQIKTSIDLGCRGNDWPTGDVNPIIDMLFALFRFVSAGVGIVVIGSIIVAGIQYSGSRGNPQTTEASMKRIYNSIIALLLYMFSFAIANFLIPGGMLF